jgi:hypothetical protein
MASGVSDDDDRWSDDVSEVISSSIWLFSKDPGRIVAYSQETGSLNIFSLNPQECHILAYLDLDYWKNVAHTSSNNRRISRYLVKLRGDIIQYFQAANHRDLEILKPWAIRLKRGFGHSHFGRDNYLKMCQSTDLLPYQDDIFDYGIYI